MKIIKVSWREYISSIKALKTKLDKLRKIKSMDSVYGIPRGGLIPAVFFSHAYSIPLVSGDVKLSKLIIDDIADTGETLYGRLYNDNNIYSTLYAKNSAVKRLRMIGIELIYVNKVPQNVWIQFPYETGR